MNTTMTFSVLAVRTGEEAESELYPEPSDLSDTVEGEAGDGTQPSLHEAIGLALVSFASGRPKQVAQFTDLSATCVVTDCRVTVACSKYDKGSKRTGFGVSSMAIAVTANAVSKARAKRRSKGRMLVGHVRHQWLGQIEATDRSGLFGKNRLDLFLGDPTTTEAELLVLSVILGKRESASSMAADIARRAARYKAAHVADQASRPGLLAYAQQATYETIHGGARRYRLPEASA